MWLIHQFDSLFHLGECKEYPIMAKPKGPGSRGKKNGIDAPATPAANPTSALSAAPEVSPAASVRTVADLRPEVKETKKLSSETRRNVAPINLEDEIRRRAYELYEQRGCAPGHENDDWLIAESEILTRYSVQRHQTA